MRAARLLIVLAMGCARSDQARIPLELAAPDGLTLDHIRVEAVTTADDHTFTTLPWVCSNSCTVYTEMVVDIEPCLSEGCADLQTATGPAEAIVDLQMIAYSAKKEVGRSPHVFVPVAKGNNAPARLQIAPP